MGVQKQGAASFTNTPTFFDNRWVPGKRQPANLRPTPLHLPSPNPHQRPWLLPLSHVGRPALSQFTSWPPRQRVLALGASSALHGVVEKGYGDGTFKPGNEITRGQIAKMVSNAAGFAEDPGARIFEDVDAANTFYEWINRLSNRGIMGGYPCGATDAEPCNPPDNRPYFRPFANATRGQLAKIVANAAGIIGSPTGQFYTDVPESNPFYVWIMRLTDLGVMSGYDCGGVGEPCDDQNRPYFRPFTNVTRGQASKIVAKSRPYP